MQNGDRAAEYIGRMKEEGVCYNLCFPLSRSLPRHVTLLDEDTVDDDYKDDDDDDICYDEVCVCVFVTKNDHFPLPS